MSRLSRHTPGRVQALTTGVMVAALAAGCGEASSGGTAGPPPAEAAMSSYAVTKAEGTTRYPLQLDNCGYKLTFAQPPKRVLVLNGTSVAEVESFVVLGLQDRIGANAQSYGSYDDPAMAAAINAIPRGGLSTNGNFDVPREQVLAFEPDLVVSTWSGGFNAKSGFATRAELAAQGIPAWVPPSNCALGKTTPASPAENQAYAKQSIESSFEMLTELGRIFDVPAKAQQTVAGLRARLAAVRARVAGRPTKNVIIAYPGMSTMMAAGIPALFSTGVSADVITSAGAANPFQGRDSEAMSKLSREELAATRVDVLAVGLFTADEKPDVEARKMFTAFPQWPASRAEAYTFVSDGAYLGPSNVFAVEKIAKAVHRD